MNKVVIEPTVFENHRTALRTYGVRVYDDHGQAYDNTWDSIPDDDMDVLQLVSQSEDETIVGIIDFVIEQGNGLYVGPTWYTFEEIKHIIVDGYEDNNNYQC